MCSGLPKAGPSRRQPFCDLETSQEQIRICFVYHLMKLLILGFLAVAMFAAASGRDCFWGWSSEARAEARERSFEARDRAREARQRAREFRREQRDEMRAFRDHMLEERDRLREEVREDMREFQRDWHHVY